MNSQNKCRFTWEDRGVYVVFEGEFTMEQIMQEHERFVGSPAFDELVYTIVDLTKADLSKIAADDAFSLVAADVGASMTLPDNIMSVVTVHPDTIQLFQFYAEQMQSVGAPWRIGIHKTVEDARTWIAEERDKIRLRNLTPKPFKDE